LTGGCSHVVTVPPAAAERLEEGRGIGEAQGLRLHQGQMCRLIRLLGSEHRIVSDGALLELLAGDGQAARCRRLRGLSGAERIGVAFERTQSVGDILERTDDCL
jgi:hypothetical protein